MDVFRLTKRLLDEGGYSLLASHDYFLNSLDLRETEAFGLAAVLRLDGALIAVVSFFLRPIMLLPFCSY